MITSHVSEDQAKLVDLDVPKADPKPKATAPAAPEKKK